MRKIIISASIITFLFLSSCGPEKVECEECNTTGRVECKECNGVSICEHKRRRNCCKDCSPMYCEYFKETYSQGGWNKHLKTKKHQNDFLQNQKIVKLKIINPY